MTGKEMIAYILDNDLLDKPLFQNGTIPGYYTVLEYAVKKGVGPATVITQFSLGMVEGIKIGNEIFISKNSSKNKGVTNEEKNKETNLFINIHSDHAYNDHIPAINDMRQLLYGTLSRAGLRD